MTNAGLVFHLAEPDEWSRAQERGRYEPASLRAEGFVHCSTGSQLARVAQSLYRGRDDMVLLEIEPAAVAATIRYEPAEEGPDLFPHIHGPIPLEAVARATPWAAGPVEAVLLDVGGVIHLPGAEPVGRALARVGIELDPARIEDAHHRAIAAYDRWRRGAEAADAYAAAFCAAMGVPRPLLEAAVTAFGDEMSRPGTWTGIVPGSREGLRRLAGAGVAIVLVSNSDGTLEERLRAAEVLQVGPGPGVPVKAVLDSGAVGLAKPDQRIFDLAVKLAGAPRNRVLHAGDSRRMDVAGAASAAIRPVHVDPARLCGESGHMHVAGLGELADLVRREAGGPIRP